jgi:hypothetical protein
MSRTQPPHSGLQLAIKDSPVARTDQLAHAYRSLWPAEEKCESNRQTVHQADICAPIFFAAS